ncbi:hypothetical protein [Achromobacter spanius]|uniref:Uncharacterized protein n=1 Tax=Achromobacter spanius TaxID=217203 RepID=A0AA42LPT8_9BURK|nr:hypothetical protein [Achromobacter spanius]MDH0737326.1 hypothetical protein [Achromobacter spanius]
MARKMDYGNWAQVIGKYDLQARRGSILSMLPADVAFASIEGGEPRVRLKGIDARQTVLFDVLVNPMTPSCGPVGPDHLFEEFVPVTPALKDVKLFIDDAEVAQYAPGARNPGGQLKLAAPAEGRLHHIPLEGDVPVAANVSYMLQVRPEGDERWHTMAAGVAQPSTANLDINQFPGAVALDVRVLRTNGLETVEILRERKDF